MTKFELVSNFMKFQTVIYPGLPLILFGCMGLIAGLLSLTFPETLGLKLPDTIFEAERIGKKEFAQPLSDQIGIQA